MKGPVALASGLLLAMMLATLAVVDGFSVMSKPLWLDEYHTLLLADRQGVLDSLRSLAQGADFNPPTLHLFYRAFDTLLGGLTPFTMRVLSLGCVWLTLVCVYATLRRHFPAAAAFGGACAIWAHPLTITYAFDARFYAPWLLFSALLAWSAGVDAARPDSRRRDVLLALSSVLVCTIHYFGIFSRTLIAVAVMVTAPDDRPGSSTPWRRRVRAVAPMLSGPLALLLCTPFYLGQRQALTTATWVAPMNAAQLQAFLADYFVWVGFVLPLAGWLGVRLLQHARDGRSFPSRSSLARPDTLALLALAAVPIIVVVFSAVVQPSLIRRYAIPALLCWAPLIAFALADMRLPARAVVLAGQLALGVVLVRAQVLGVRQVVRDLSADAASIRATGPDASVVCRTRQRLYQLAAPAAGEPAPGTGVCRFLDFDEATAQTVRGAAATDPNGVRFLTVERDVARVHARIYGFPALSPVEQLRQRDRFYLLDETDTEAFSHLWFPAFDVRGIAPRLFLLQRTSPPISSHVPDAG